MMAKPGHLSSGKLNLKQTEKVKRSLSDRQKFVEAMKKHKPVALNWQPSEAKTGRRGFD